MCSASRLRIAARTAGERALSGKTCHVPDGPGALAGGSGASSKIRCAFVPPMPKELTPARRGPPPGGAGQGLVSVQTAKGDSARTLRGFGSAKCKLGTSVRCRSISAALTNPAIPAAQCRWPTLDLTEPNPTEPGVRPAVPNTLASAAISIGSPSAVPVPCASTYPIAAGERPATASASRSTASCPSCDGA